MHLASTAGFARPGVQIISAAHAEEKACCFLASDPSADNEMQLLQQ